MIGNIVPMDKRGQNTDLLRRLMATQQILSLLLYNCKYIFTVNRNMPIACILYRGYVYTYIYLLLWISYCIYIFVWDMVLHIYISLEYGFLHIFCLGYGFAFISCLGYSFTYIYFLGIWFCSYFLFGIWFCMYLLFGI